MKRQPDLIQNDLCSGQGFYDTFGPLFEILYGKFSFDNPLRGLS